MRTNHVSNQAMVYALARDKEFRAAEFENRAYSAYIEVICPVDPTSQCLDWDDMLEYEAHARMWASWPSLYEFRFRPLWAKELPDGTYEEQEHPRCCLCGCQQGDDR